MKNQSDQKISEVADKFVNSFVSLCNKRILTLISIMLLLFALASYFGASFKGEFIVPFLLMSFIYALLLRRSFYLKKFKKYLTENSIYIIKAKGIQKRGIRDTYSYVDAMDEKENFWRNLKCSQTLSAFDIESNYNDGYIVYLEPIKTPMFINNDLISQIKEISNKILPMPQDKFPKPPKELTNLEIILIGLSITFFILFVPIIAYLYFYNPL